LGSLLGVLVVSLLSMVTGSTLFKYYW
jgi:hypothetical protein